MFPFKQSDEIVCLQFKTSLFTFEFKKSDEILYLQFILMKEFVLFQNKIQQDLEQKLFQHFFLKKQEQMSKTLPLCRTACLAVKKLAK